MNTLPEHDAATLLNTLHLLYVEDDPDAMAELARFLKKRVSALTTASNGQEALALCGTHTFDAILTDLRMPEMDGLEFVRSLRHAGIATPVVITSAFSDSETILKAVDLGIVKYCVKPIDTDQLLGSLCRIAAEHLTGSGELMLPRNRLLDRQQRLEAEKMLKSGYAHLLKTLTGKGPRDIHVALGATGVELKATDVLTALEQTLMQDSGNDSMVAYLRRALYTCRQQDFEALVAKTLDVTAALGDIRIIPTEGSDCLVFRFK